MMGSRRLVARLILGSAAAFVSLSPARADGIAVEPVTFPAPFFEAPRPGETAYRLDNVLEASGVEPIGDGRLLLVAHDKKVPLRVIETATGRQVGPLLTCDEVPGRDAEIFQVGRDGPRFRGQLLPGRIALGQDAR